MNTTIVGPFLEDRNIENPSRPITPEALAAVLGGGPTQAGPPVTPETSVRLVTVLACVRILSESFARMPFLVYRRVAGGNERATDHPLYEPLRLRPNPSMSAFFFWVNMIVNRALWGNGYAEIVRSATGRPVGLMPIEARRVEPYRVGMEIVYRVTVGSKKIDMASRDIFHLPGVAFDGVKGISAIQAAREQLGTAAAADRLNAAYMRNGLRPSFAISVQGNLTDQVEAKLRPAIEKMHSGVDNAGRFLILGNGATATPISMPLNDAQWVESSNLRVEEICRLFGVPPHKVQSLLRSTNNNIEQQSIDFRDDCLAPIVEAARQEAEWKLFDGAERGVYFAEHLTQAIVSMDSDGRMKLYQGLRNCGAINADEIRRLENMNSLPDGRGLVYTIPSTLMPSPSPAQADKLLEAWTRKGGGTQPDSSGAPTPKSDGKVAGASNAG